MVRYSQQDYRWSDVLIGQSKSQIKYKGCLITALCMIFNKFHPGHYYWPRTAAKDWAFLGDNLDWIKTKFPGMTFVERTMGFPADKIRDYIKNPEYGVVIQCLTKSGVHWLACWDWGIFGKPICFDPWNGTVLYNPYGYFGKYVRVIGFAVMKKADII